MVWVGVGGTNAPVRDLGSIGLLAWVFVGHLSWFGVGLDGALRSFDVDAERSFSFGAERSFGGWVGRAFGGRGGSGVTAGGT